MPLFDVDEDTDDFDLNEGLDGTIFGLEAIFKSREISMTSHAASASSEVTMVVLPKRADVEAERVTF